MYSLECYKSHYWSRYNAFISEIGPESDIIATSERFIAISERVTMQHRNV